LVTLFTRQERALFPVHRERDQGIATDATGIKGEHTAPHTAIEPGRKADVGIPYSSQPNIGQGHVYLFSICGRPPLNPTDQAAQLDPIAALWTV